MSMLFIRLGLFCGVFAGLALWEHWRPRRVRALPYLPRWGTNWGMSIIDAVLLRLIFGAGAVGAAMDAQAMGIGLMPWMGMPGWLACLCALLVFDLAIWFQHLLSHKIPLFWRLHRVHHVDRDVDVTTAIRFHPGEIILSMGFKIGLIYALGAPVLAVVVFEIVLNAMAMFNHANLRLPQGLDRWLRRVVVTPDMHRVHHSVRRLEHDSNYGFNLSVWDRIFRTYRAQPLDDHATMTLGLARYQGAEPARLGWSLVLPLRD